MAIRVKTGASVWSSVSELRVKTGINTWSDVIRGRVQTALNVWSDFFTATITPTIASTVTISRNNATYPSTLTGTNYYWTNSTSLTYVFQKSSDNSSWSNIGSATSIANPSSGSSNTVTYALTLADMPAFTSYYRFVVTAANSTYSTSATSTSTSVSVNQPAPINTVQPTITPSTGTVGVTQYSVTSNGTWDPVDTDGLYDYLWQSYDTPSYVSAPGVNNLSTYTPPSNFLTLGYFSPIRCRVTATNASGSTSAVSSNTATVLGVALTPTFGANTSTAGGFTGSVTNYSASYTWGISTNSGSVSFGTPSGSTYPFTVTGLSSSASATVTVTTSRTGYNSGSAQTTGTANAAPSPPTINSSSATTTSITLNFTLGANSTSTRAYLNGVLDGSTSGTSYTFSGLSPGTAYALALFGYNGIVQSTTSSGGSFSTNNGAALTPTFGSNTSTSGGFTGSVTNYNANYTWGISVSVGSVSFGTASGVTLPFTVTGLSSGQSATVTVTTSRTGYTGGSAQTTGTARTIPSAPTINSSSSTTTSITLNFSAGANSTSTRAYINGSFDGSTAGTSYTFSGLSPGTAYTLALYGYDGVNLSATAASGSYSTSTGAALTPTFGANTSVSGGFTGSVTNYSASYTWGISTNSGSVSFGSPSGSTYPFTVSGLGSGASATVTVTTSRTGYAGGSAQTTGTATTQVPVNTVAPTITPTSGTAGTTTYSVNSVGSWTNSPTSYGYQWQYNDGGSTYLSISGATSSSYSPPSNFFSGLFYASPIRCRVTASNAGGAGTAAFSNTATVAAPAVAPSGGTVSISTNTGNYVVGSVITFSTSGWSGSPTSYSLRLYNGTNPVLTSDPQRGSTINGTSGTYTIQSIDVPYYFKAFATASNSAGTSTEASSTQVGPAVAAAGAVPVLISLTGDNSLALGGTFSWSFSNSPTAYSLFVTGPSGTVYTTSNAYTYNSTTFRPGYDGTGWQGTGTYTIYVSAQNTTGNSLVAPLSTSMS